MSDSVDYIYPGSVFLCFGLLSTIHTFYLSVVGKTQDAALCQSLTAKFMGFTVPIEGTAKVVLCLIGGCIIMCWSLVATIQGGVFLIQSCSFTGISMIALKNFVLLLHGSWFWHIGFSDYIYSYYTTAASTPEQDTSDQSETSTIGDVRVSAVASAFSIHVMFCFMFVAVVHILMSVFLGKREEGSSRSVSRCEEKPLISDGDESDLETTEFNDMIGADKARDQNANEHNSNQLQF